MMDQFSNIKKVVLAIWGSPTVLPFVYDVEMRWRQVLLTGTKNIRLHIHNTFQVLDPPGLSYFCKIMCPFTPYMFTSTYACSHTDTLHNLIQKYSNDSLYKHLYYMSNRGESISLF